MEKEYKYYAFISYKREDASHAKWLKRKFQNYRLPVGLRELAGNRVYLSPVFRDQDDLIPGQLLEKLYSSLESSRFLIVICSRNAHDHSKYLDMEIQAFLKSGHSVRDIIPLIVDEDSERPELECFPSELQKLNENYELIGANFRDSSEKTHAMRKHDAFLKIVSNMLGIMMTEVKNLDEIRKKKQKILIFVSALLSFLALLYGCIYYWQHLMPHIFYYRDYVLEENAAQGIEPLNPNSLHSEQYYYKFVKINDQVRSIEYLNSAGQLTAPEPTVLNEGAARIQYNYTGDGLASASYYDTKGRLIVCYRFENGGTHISRTRGENSSVISYMPTHIADMGNVFANDRTLVSKYIQRYENGRLTLRLFAHGDTYSITHNSSNQAEAFSEDSLTAMVIYGYAFEYDDEGRIIKMRYVNTPEGDTQGVVDGINAISYQYDNQGQLNKICNINLSGVPAENSDGWAYCVYLRDGQGRLIREEYRNAAGLLTMCQDGYAIREYSYDGFFVSRVSYLDTKEMPATLDYYASVTYLTDSLGRVVKEEYWDKDGNSPYTRTGLLIRQTTEYLSERETRYVSTYNSNVFGFETGNRNCDMISTLVTEGLETCADGFQRYIQTYTYYDPVDILDDVDYTSCRIEYDPENYIMLRTSYLSPSGSLKSISKGQKTALILQDTNSNGQVTSIREYTEKYDPRQGEDYGLLRRISYAYDKMGYLCSVQDWQHNTYPKTENSLGLEEAVGRQIIRDHEGKVFEVRYVNQNGNLMHNKDGIAAIQYRYDQAGRLTLATTLNRDGLVTEVNGHAYRKQEYDSRGNLSAIRYLKTDQTPGSIYNNGYYGQILWKYDESGHLLEQQINDPWGNPIDGYELPCQTLCTYDDAGNCTSKQYFEGSFSLVNASYETFPSHNVSEEGYARAEWTYDDQGNMTSEQFFEYSTQDGKFYPFIPKSKSYALAEWDYDKEGHMIYEAFYGPSDEDPCELQPIVPKDNYYSYAEWYYENGQKVEEFFYKAKNGEEYPYCGTVYTYNEQGQVTSEVFYTSDGNDFAITTQGTAKTEYVYDKNGFCSDIIYYSFNEAEFQPLINEVYEISRFEDTYSDRGEMLARTCFAYDGQKYYPQNIDGADRWEQTFDDNGNTTSYTEYEWDGMQLVPTTQTQYTYSESGNISKTAYFKWNGQEFVPHYDPLQYFALKENTYNEWGQLLCTSFFTTDGTDYFPLVISGRGYAKKENTYDDHSNLTSVSYFGSDGKNFIPIVPEKEGYFQVKYTYEADGRPSTVMYFGADGIPIVPSEYGYARIEYTYDGNCITTVLYEWDGEAYCPIIQEAGYYSKAVMVYDAYDKLLEASYFNWNGSDWYSTYLDGSSYAKMVMTYDHRGNCTTIAYYGTDGTDYFPILEASSGYAKVTDDYDVYGNHTKTEYWGVANGEYVPINLSFDPLFYWDEESTYAKTETEYDQDGQYIGSREYITDGKQYYLTSDTTGGPNLYLYLTYDDNFRITHQKALDYQKKPVNCEAWDCSAMEMEYDESGNLTAQRTYKLIEEELLQVDGFKKAFDANGNVLWEEIYRRYDSDGSIGKYRHEYEYGADGKQLSRKSYHWEDGKWIPG